MSVTALIVAAGSGKRMNRHEPKQFLQLGNKPIAAWTLGVFERSNLVDQIILVIPPGKLEYCWGKIIKKYRFRKVAKIVNGGRRRQDSVYEGLKQVEKDCEIVIIHDGVRPFITQKMISDSLEAVKKYKACIFALPVKETIKKIDKNNQVKQTIIRQELVSVQTPQVFEFKLIKKAYEVAFKDRFYGTDDAMLVERLGKKVKVLMGSYENIKITTPQDLMLAEIIQKNILKSKKRGVKL